MRSLVVVVLLALAACGGPAAPAAPPPTGDVPEAALDPHALEQWASFPVDARPRPLLLDALPVLPHDGFTGDEKGAVVNGHYDLAAPLPPDPPRTVTVSLPEGRFPVATVTARKALDALTAQASAPSSGPAARITGVRFGEAVFGTDRGGRVLPAWLLTVPGATGPLGWPAVSPSLYRAPTTGIIHGTRVSADGRTLTVVMPGPGPQPPGCPGMWRVRWVPAVAESRAAVDVGVRSALDGIEPGIPQAGCGRCDGCATAAVGYNAVYVVPLAAPLGNRVLLGPVGVGPHVVLAVEPT